MNMLVARGRKTQHSDALEHAADGPHLEVIWTKCVAVLRDEVSFIHDNVQKRGGAMPCREFSAKRIARQALRRAKEKAGALSPRVITKSVVCIGCPSGKIVCQCIFAPGIQLGALVLNQTAQRRDDEAGLLPYKGRYNVTQALPVPRRKGANDIGRGVAQHVVNDFALARAQAHSRKHGVHYGVDRVTGCGRGMVSARHKMSGSRVGVQ